jgi:hydroxymethylpyrimidine pyrophosphatase-like HAD family hydrolase
MIIPNNYPKIIAVDFDGCLVTNKWPKIGEPIAETIDALKAEQANGAKVILWTCRSEEKREENP